MRTSRNSLHILLLGIFLLTSMSASAQTLTPKWMHKPPEPTHANKTYTFTRISADASSLAIGRNKCFQLLALDQSLLNTLTISYHSDDHITTTSRVQDGNFKEDLNQKTFEVITTEGKPIQVKAKVIDEYFVPDKQSITTLYQVALTPNAVFDNCMLTTSYASDPANWGLMLIPGAAQMYKGSYLKGGLIMGGAVLFAGGIITFESMRADYVKKIATTHSADVKKAYNDRANNMATARNICIGGVAALYVYNIIDALVAPGARRVIVTPSATVNGPYGMALRYNF